MSVNAISSYSSATQYQYFSSAVSDDQVQSLLQQYGLIPTGDDSTDLQALYEAMYAAAQTNVTSSSSATDNSQQSQNSQATDAENSTNIPWSDLMSQVGLYASGDYTTDYEAFNDKITSMQASGALSQQDQATINELLSEASIIFVQPTDSSSQTSTQSSYQLVSGADIQAQLNRMYLLG